VGALAGELGVGVPGLGLLLPVLAHDLGAPQAGVVASEQRHPQRRRHVRVAPPVRRGHPVRPPCRVGAGLDARELPVPGLDVRLCPAGFFFI
jgi:hypothetical protein